MPSIYFIISLLAGIGSTLAVRWLARQWGIMDHPSSDRKIHREPTPLLGGLAVFLSFFFTLYLAGNYLLAGSLQFHHWFGVFVGGAIIMIGGALDDRYSLKPGHQIIFPILAVLAVVAGGVGIEKVTNPLGGYLYLEQFKLPMLMWQGVWHYFVVWADVFTIVWLFGMMYTTKLLDGMDGLVTGMTAVGGFVIFLFTTTTRYYQPDVGLAALILSGACLGFLIFNWHPASIFLGEGGSLFLGYILGVLAVISGGKIAIALLIMGIPILDVAWTIVRRLIKGKNPFKFADRQHLHFRILDRGFTQRQTALIFYAFALLFGLSGLFLQSIGKVYALVVLVIIMFALVVWFGRQKKA